MGGSGARSRVCNGLEELPFHVEIRAHLRSRRMKLSYRLNRGFLLTHPPQTPQRLIREFLMENRSWMTETHERAQAHPTHPASLREHLGQTPFVTFGATVSPVRFGAGCGLLEERPQEIVIFEGISESRLSWHLWQLARKHLPSVLELLSDEVGVRSRLRRIQVRNQRCRWGSCSSSGSLSLNWRLILLPPALQRHILLHELAHLIHLNHSSAFWTCLMQWDPETPHYREWLRSSGAHWMALGREGSPWSSSE